VVSVGFGVNFVVQAVMASKETAAGRRLRILHFGMLIGKPPFAGHPAGPMTFWDAPHGSERISGCQGRGIAACA
jgi:hypothetical protein